MASQSGVPSSVVSNPPGGTVGGIAFTPLTDKQWELIKDGYYHDKSVTVTYTAGPPIAVTNVSAP